MDDLPRQLRHYARDSNDGYLTVSALYAADLIEAQAAEIRSLRAQVAQERAGIVAWLRKMENSKMDRIDSILSAGGPDYNLGRCTAYAHAAAMIERHEDKGPRA
jgi:hypothetical protein